MSVGNTRGGKTAIVLLLVLSLVWSGANTAYLAWQTPGESPEGEVAADGAFVTGEKYTLYIGLDDKDEHRQVISTAKARETVNAICAKYADGYTAHKATGSWVDESGTLVQENTLVYQFYSLGEEELTQLASEVRTALNQSSILVERAQTSSRYLSS